MSDIIVIVGIFAIVLSYAAVIVWHPDSPGMKVVVRPCLLRRLGIIRSPFATLGEVLYSDTQSYGEVEACSK